jgi:ribonuclease D
MSQSQGNGDAQAVGSAGRREKYSPGKFRSQSHASAHAEHDGAHDGPRIDHPLVTHAPPQFIDRQDDLLDMLAHLRSVGRFAYDSEFIGELTYIPKLCLIQVASSQRIGLIDPLGDLDLSPFWELLCDPAIEKIVHAGQQDIEPIFRNCGKRAENIFDTQICAGFVGLAYPASLSKLVAELTGAKLGKGLTFTHWDQRPLSEMQLRYAADDVRYLVAVREILHQKLTQQRHSDWARAECQSLCDPSQYGFNPASHYLRIRGANSLPVRGQAILRELTIWRDGCARSHNIPPRTFLRDEILLDLARAPVKTVEKLDRVRGLPRPVEQSHGADIVAVINRAAAIPPENLPQVRDYEPTPRQRFAADAVFAAFQCLCAGQSIDPALIASRQEVGELYRALSSGEPIDDHPLTTGWRRDAAGAALIDLITGKRRMQVQWDTMMRSSTMPIDAATNLSE